MPRSRAHLPIGQLAYFAEDRRQFASSIRAELDREPRPLPAVRLNEAGLAVTDVHAFRGEHFDVADYDPHPGIARIPVAP